MKLLDLSTGFAAMVQIALLSHEDTTDFVEKCFRTLTCHGQKNKYYTILQISYIHILSYSQIVFSQICKVTR